MNHQKKDLGRHAFEEHMPPWLHNKLEIEDQKSATVAPTLIPNIARLLEQDNSVRKAYLCHPSVRCISKIKGEGNHFCAYRNMQMMIRFLLEVDQGFCVRMGEQIPSVLQLQDMIEDAWSEGINSYGRVQTGGIRGTRKHIGTPEVCEILREYSYA